MIRLENNDVLKTLTKNLTFVDAYAGGSTNALRVGCSGKLKRKEFVPLEQILPFRTDPFSETSKFSFHSCFPSKCIQTHNTRGGQ